MVAREPTFPDSEGYPDSINSPWPDGQSHSGFLTVARVAGAAKRRQLGMLQLQFLGSAEESNVLAVRPGPASFYVVHPQLVQLPHNVKLVFQRE
jgi:hypothetical protein